MEEVRNRTFEKQGFAVTLFMFLAGIGFILLSIFIVSRYMSYYIDRHYIKNHGIEAIATISYVRIPIRREDRASCHLEYYADGKKYTDYFEPRSDVYRKGDKIKIYYLEENPKKIYNPYEYKKNDLVTVIYGAGLTMALGIICLKTNNIFKYKKEIIVE